ncbi:hypothetical protein AJ80_04660 [Polytolypa hystricis UAMH7299]|uniref:Amino acid permease/ SLC12A domain-containing protein n=1 Tax=Polytolypa hystricis (strain UAMH7299) TaxID=1447883 RepID=A0A2B7YB59_POLH7|nr:hypothetical protein AJ80_04660 [Polytolypa hystricis UAMH7299]
MDNSTKNRESGFASESNASSYPLQRRSNNHNPKGANVVEGTLEDCLHRPDVAREQPKDQDEADMIEMGRAQQTKRTFGLFTLLGFTTIVLLSWESVYPFFLYGYLNGGGITMIYGYAFCWMGVLATGASIAEIASMYPSSGGTYHWVALLAPPKYANFLSWFTGWMSILGWQSATAAGTWCASALIQGLVTLNHPNFEFQRWHGTMLLYAVLLVSVFINTLAVKVLPPLEGLFLVLHVLGFFAILIPLVQLAPMRFDGAAHMAEEVKNAAINVTRSMFWTIILNGCLGFAAVLVTLFAMGNEGDIVAHARGFAWQMLFIFTNATGSVAGATLMTCIMIVLIFGATFGYIASASRQLWAFARDRGVPFSHRISHIDKRFAIPTFAIGMTAVIHILIGLINVASAVAFSAMVSLLTVGLYSTYLMSIALLLRKRLLKEQIDFGPWRLHRLGLPLNIVAVCYSLIIVVFSFFPPAIPVTPRSMNWSSVVFVAMLLFGVCVLLCLGAEAV